MAELKQFLGCWVEIERTGFEEIANALGFPEEKIYYYGLCKKTIAYERDGDEWKISVGTKENPHCRQYTFHLGEPYDSQDIDGSVMRILVNTDGSKLVEKHTYRLTGALMDVTRHVDGDNMIVQTSYSGHTMMTEYKKT